MTNGVATKHIRLDKILEAYTDKVSYAPGETIVLKYNSTGFSPRVGSGVTNEAFPEPGPDETYRDVITSKYSESLEPFSLELIRYNGFVEEKIVLNDLLPSETVTVSPTEVHAREAYGYMHEANLPNTFSFTLPIDAKPGIYAFHLYKDPQDLSTQSKCNSWATFIVKGASDPQDQNKLLVLASSNTWQAYNTWGGSSFYRTEQGDPYRPLGELEACSGNSENSANLQNLCINFVTYERPNINDPDNLNNHLMGGERHLLEWLRKHNIPYDMIADLDLHNNPSVISGYEAVIISTHSEYWSRSMYDGLSDYVYDQGGDLIYLTGNGIYWKVTIVGHEIEVRKYQPGEIDDSDTTDTTDNSDAVDIIGAPATSDGSSAANADELTTLTHRDGTGGGRIQDASTEDIGPESDLTGVKYTHGAANNSAGLEVITPNHWVFNCTGLSQGDLFAKYHSGKANCGLKNYGLDEFFCGQGGSGWETDIMDDNESRESLVHLAKGANSTVLSTKYSKLSEDGSLELNESMKSIPPGADMIYYEPQTPNGGSVFSIGSINIGRSLSLSEQNPALNRIMLNVLENANVIDSSECSHESLSRNLNWYFKKIN